MHNINVPILPDYMSAPKDMIRTKHDHPLPGVGDLVQLARKVEIRYDQEICQNMQLTQRRDEGKGSSRQKV